MKFKTVALLSLAASSTVSLAEIKQSLGVDQRVDYKSLTKYGPWDDRNYQLTKEDLAIIPKKDQYLANIPVFFKIEKRKELPHLGEFYPRSTLQHFQILHGGLIVDGVWYKQALGLGYHPDPPTDKVGGIEVKKVVRIADHEVSLESGVLGNEVSIECNPTNKNNCVAGSNSSGGQTMYYSSDGGTTWEKSQTNSSSCCDPTVDWSFDGSIVYQADLSSSIGVRWTRSLDQGHTWEPMKVITTSGSDKEFIHVDRSPTSPHKDNLYITWHNGNVMQFARSTDMGVSMSTPIAFTAEEKGIGSDITTDSAGNVYYFYPSTEGGGIRLLKSTDGGVTFAAGIQVAAIRGRFDFPIPAMETREAFIYVSADIDSNDNIYVSFTDETAGSVGGGTGSAAQNHGEVRVFKSTDAGATWNELPRPHSTTDSNTVDRFHPWLKVGENDVVHIGFYDTRHSTNRTGVDFYYNVSTDGGASWEFPNGQRYSTQTSSNITNSQEWGDYNGLSVVLDKIAMTWTDNRPGGGQVAMVGTSQNQFAEPTFGLSVNPTELSVCANATGNSVALNVQSLMSYSGTVTLSTTATPSFLVNPAFSANAQTAPFTSNFTFDVNGSGSTGVQTLTIQGSGTVAGSVVNKTADININYSAASTTGSTLTAPADASTNVQLKPTFSWSADANALNYLLEVATDNGFSNVVLSETVSGSTSFTPTGDLPSSTNLYWRVTAQSPCGNAVSSIFSFSSTALPGDCPMGYNQFDVIKYTFDVPDPIYLNGFETSTRQATKAPGTEGWTRAADVGVLNWSLQPVGESGSTAFQADDLAAVNDTSLYSPEISLPTGVGPLTLRFWNTQRIEDSSSGCYDGAVLEVSSDGGNTYVPITNAQIINDDYKGPISSSFGNPLGGRNAWCGDPMTAKVFNVDIDSFAGSNVKFRFRIASDRGVGRAEGWAIDNVRVTGCRTP